MINRMQSDEIRKSKKSILLLGPRQTGKSTLIKNLNPDLVINLADQQVFLDYSQDFNLLRSQIERKKSKTIFIDEVQRLPALLNTVQSLIDDSKGLKFYLSGSSARKLKKGGANLLPGRVINYNLGGLTLSELNYEFKKEDLIYGFLPGIYVEKDKSLKKDILTSYSANYLNEEIKAEALVRDLPSFTRFLQSCTDCVGQFVDYTKFAQRTQISRHQVSRYFEIFEDTMIGQRIYPYPEFLEKYDLVKHSKFYLFDVGVYNGLSKSFNPSNDRLGVLAEQFVFQQLLHSAGSQKKDLSIHTLRTRGGVELDFMIELEQKKIGIEVKSSLNVIDDDVRHLAHFKKNEPSMDCFLFYIGKNEIKKNGIWCLPMAVGFKEIGL